MIHDNKKTEYFHVAGVSGHGESLKKLAKLNPDWNTSVDDIVAAGRAGQKIFRLKFITRPVEIRKNQSSGTLDIYVAEQSLGYIHPNEVGRVKDIIKNCEIHNIACGIWGGQCKVIDEFYGVETSQTPLVVNLKIEFSEPLSIDDDFDNMLFAEPEPVATEPVRFNRAEATRDKQNQKRSKKIKKPLYKRWWFLVAILMLVFTLFAGIGSEEETDMPSDSMYGNQVSDSKEAETENAVVPQVSIQEKPLEESGSLGDFDVQINDYLLAKDYEGKPVIVISYTFSNNSEENASACVNLICSAYQNGVQLEGAYVVDNSVYNAEDSMKEIKPGASIEITEAYILTSDTAPVDIEISETFSFGEEKIGKIFNISEGGETVLSKAPTGTVTGNINGFEVCIVSYKLVEDYEGRDAILFELGYTNNNDDTYSFMSTIDFTPFQNGVELEMAIMVDENEYAGYSMLNVRPGAGIPLTFAYLLADDTTPVEIEITDFWGFTDDIIETTINIA